MSGSRSEYIDLVESGVETLRRPNLTEYWEGEHRDDEWGGRHRIIQDYALIYAVLHEFTGEADYRDLAIEHLLEFGRGDHFASILTGTAFELVGDELSPSERETFGEAWIADAEGALDQYVGDGNDIEEWEQVSNHAIAACFYTDYACHLFPDMAAQHDYQERTDRVWDVWWNRREFHEQASNYEGVTETFLAKWATIRGKEEAFYDSPTVRNIFERNLRSVTPKGIVAPYGDSGYHQHQCKWIGLFERIGADTSDGRFLDAAADIRSYFRKHIFEHFLETVKALPEHESIYNGRLIFKNHLHEIAWLALAAFWHDTDVEQRPRPEPAGRIRRTPYGYVLSDSDERVLPDERMVDGQVALTAGTPGSGDHTYLLLSVGPELVHDHADASAIQVLSRDATTLLGSNGYLQRELLYHNAFYAQPSDWDRYPEDDHSRIITGDENCRGEIETIDIDGRTAHCRVTFDQFHGMPLSVTREVLLDECGEVTLIDRVRAHEDGYCGGPLFHAETIEESDGYYRLRTDQLRSLGNVVSENPPGDLLVTTTYPDADVTVAQPDLPPIYDEGYQEFPTTEYKQVWQRSYVARNCLAARKPFEANEESVFVTQLRPEL